MSHLEQSGHLADASHHSYDDALYYRERPESDIPGDAGKVLDAAFPDLQQT
jgi:hypothetical protein